MEDLVNTPADPSIRISGFLRKRISARGKLPVLLVTPGQSMSELKIGDHGGLYHRVSRSYVPSPPADPNFHAWWCGEAHEVLIENASARHYLPAPSLMPEAFPIKASDHPQGISISFVHRRIAHVLLFVQSYFPKHSQFSRGLSSKRNSARSRLR